MIGVIECPWCNNQIEIQNGRCPNCKTKLYEMNEDDFEPVSATESIEIYNEELDIEQEIEANFECSKCAGTDCSVKEVAMTGAGLSKLFDIQHNHYLFVSCTSCGFVEVYDPNVLRGMKVGQLGTVMDVIFGG